MSLPPRLCVAATFALAAWSPAQIGPPRVTPAPAQPQAQEPSPIETLDSRWVRDTAPALQGFPVFPRELPGYGTYPRSGQPGGTIPGFDTLPPAVEVPGWPTWLQAMASAKAADPAYQPDRAILVRHGDRVWFKTPEEEAFVPLYHWDQTRVLVAGSEVEVRQAGEFELLLHGGGRLLTHGPTRLRLAELATDRVRLELPQFTRARVNATGRAYEIVLPDGSWLAVPPDQEESLPQSAADLILERADEPEWFGGRATIFHAGGRQVLWHSRFGDVLLDPGHRVVFFLTPPAATIAAPLRVDGVVGQPDGTHWRGTADRADASLAWSGARFTLPAGARIDLDPLLGRPFPAAAK